MENSEENAAAREPQPTFSGTFEALRGDKSNIRGTVSPYLRGDVSRISGDVSKLRGDARRFEGETF
jgi:hypothetical protein